MNLPKVIQQIMKSQGFSELRPSQQKAMDAGLMDRKNVLVCTPTASGKTFIGEIAIMNTLEHGIGKAVYIVPLKALASEKFREFQKRYGDKYRIALSIGDMDKVDDYLSDYDIIITTSEKLDSLIRHRAHWLGKVKCVIIDEIHLLNDPGRGPTLEIILILLKKLVKDLQLVGLSATIGNPEELSEWLGAELVEDTWRPTVLKQGVYLDGEIRFEKTQ